MRLYRSINAVKHIVDCQFVFANPLIKIHECDLFEMCNFIKTCNVTLIKQNNSFDRDTHIYTYIICMSVYI